MDRITNVLNPRRLGRLFLRELAVSYRGVLVAAAAAAGAIIVVSAVSSLVLAAGGAPAGSVQGNHYEGFFGLLLFVGGCIVTSLAFREVWQPGGGIAYLSLPGSPLEKLAVKLLLTSVGYAVGSLAFTAGVGAASEALDRLVFGVGHGFFNPFSAEALQAAVRYLVVQAFFLLGSIWFRKLAFVKTVLWLLVAAVVLAILAGIAMRIAVGPRLAAMGNGTGRVGGWMLQLGGGGYQNLFAPGSRGYAGAEVFKVVAEGLLIALAPASWVAAYFRLREAEV
ncbi:MAG TPA: hypothetical protein VFI08_05340 [Spirochaetia bacterium]|nr:hypothetical protein [Spirochaetia bacterium]